MVAQEGRGRDVWSVAVFVIRSTILAVVDVRLGLFEERTSEINDEGAENSEYRINYGFDEGPALERAFVLRVAVD